MIHVKDKGAIMYVNIAHFWILLNSTVWIPNDVIFLKNEYFKIKDLFKEFYLVEI